jgi:hypothetical protein
LKLSQRELRQFDLHTNKVSSLISVI